MRFPRSGSLFDENQRRPTTAEFRSLCSSSTTTSRPFTPLTCEDAVGAGAQYTFGYTRRARNTALTASRVLSSLSGQTCPYVSSVVSLRYSRRVRRDVLALALTF
jgi:hypothetical protein